MNNWVETSLFVNVAPVANTPTGLSPTTYMNQQTTYGLQIGRSIVDGDEVTHFYITNIGNGTLYQNDGTTPISSGQFITAAEGAGPKIHTGTRLAGDGILLSAGGHPSTPRPGPRWRFLPVAAIAATNIARVTGKITTRTAPLMRPIISCGAGRWSKLALHPTAAPMAMATAPSIKMTSACGWYISAPHSRRFRSELLGDYNRDEPAVDAGDYVVWRKTLNQGVARYSGGDGDGDGTVDQDDFNVWRANFGNTLSPGAGSGSGGCIGATRAGECGSRCRRASGIGEVTVPLLSSSPKQESKPLLPKSCRCRSSHSSLPGRPLMSSRRSLST